MRANRSLLLVLFCTLATAILVHGQTHTGYISIDCGAPIKGIERDIVTGISYTSDDDFITTGDNFNVSEEYNYPANPNLPYVLADVRAFPKGDRNCYSLKPSDATDNLYLIRASFMYGNYDGGVNQKALPEFDLYLNVNFWSTVKFKNASEQVFKEILTYTDSEFLYVCLVNKGRGTPFISGLELRPVNSPIYNTEFGRNISLVLYQRWDTGYLNGTGRYQNDVYDRIWSPYTPDSWSSIRTTEYIDVFQSGYSPPYEVINTAASPKSEEEPMELLWTSDDTNATFYAYLYFAEFETLETNESRKMKISWNGSPFSEDPFISPFEYSTTLSASRSFTSDHLISLQKTEDSTLPPMLNAIEIFTAQSLDEFYTATEEVQAMETIRSTYKVKKVWSGDPCAPRLYPWDGIGCSYNNNNHHIKSLNLSSSGLQGPIILAFKSLTLVESLDLSNNDLQYNVPEFLADLKHLKSLNLKGNNFTGFIPKSLMKKFQEGLLALSVDDKNLCNSSSCQEKKKNNMVVPIAVATSVIVLLVVLVIIWVILRQRKRGADAGPGPIPPSGKRRFIDNAGPGPFLLPSGKRRFTYDEVSSITNNFNKVIGKGGFGIVYLGSLENGTKVAVKMIKDSLSTLPNGASSSSSSTRASKEFQVESDVYSFGIVLLELITGQRAIVRTKEGEKISVIHFVEPFLETGELDGVVDPLLQGDYSSDSAWKFVEVAMSCVRERGFNRPAMNQVVSELQQCLAAELAREPERSSEGNGDREVIPASYYDELPLVLPKTALLQGSDGGCFWKVAMVKRRDEVYFGQGWSKFVEDNGLRDGDVLTFVYDGSRSFTVDIYGGSRACKEVRAVALVISVDDDDDDDDEEDTNTSSEPEMAQTVPNARNQEDSTIIEPEVAQRVPRTRNKGKKRVVVQDSDDSFISEDSDSLSDSSYSPPNDDTLLDVTPKVTNSRKKGELRSVNSNVGSTSNSSGSVSRKRQSTIKNPEVYLDDPNNVCFEIIIKNRIYELNVPKQIVKDYCLKFQAYVCYIDNHGKLEARAATWQDQRVTIKKWERICKRNGLKKGDRLLCEIFRKEGLVYAVKIHVVATTS
ncbi:unnamed protein product [Brassica rapa]|uniref:TF-B3 domain-containing protein n=1 Tax=Brassica campestris TaxID=3711 RepID=A0A8D9GUV0_BRACM|nr:unnamed protein product [Brassica rapa]